MAVTAKSLGIDQLGIEDKLALVDEIWASICADRAALALTEAQRMELMRRMADDEEFPDDVAPWDEIKADTLSTLGK